MNTVISFTVELDNMAIRKGLDQCVLVYVTADVETFFDGGPKDIYIDEVTILEVQLEDGTDIRTELTTEDLAQIQDKAEDVAQDEDYSSQYFEHMACKAEYESES
jgi:hypothetical protein